MHLPNIAMTITALPDWTPLQTILLGYPHRPDVWRDSAAPAQAAIVHFAYLILAHTSISVTILSPHPPLLPSHPRLHTLKIPMDDCWIRDTGPIFTKADAVMANCFRFNAWGGEDGGCYQCFDNDLLVAGRLAREYCLQRCDVDMILEGGSVSFDGFGTCLTTEQCLLHRNRNPNLTKQHIEKIFAKQLGVTRVIWLPLGAVYDNDTDGHVDNMAVFTQPQHIALVSPSETYSLTQYERSQEALSILRNTTDALGNKIHIHEIPAVNISRTKDECNIVDGAKARPPKPICASYLNFVLINTTAFIPTFDHSHDIVAQTALGNALPPNTCLIGVPSREFVLSGGGIHCLTLGIPDNIP